MRYLFFILSIFLTAEASASKAVILGSVDNAVMKEIRLQINRRYLDNTVITESTILNENNKFSFEIDIVLPQLVTLEYARNYTEIYIQPGGDVTIDFDANSFKFSMQFSGMCGVSNQLLHEFRNNFPEETNKFKMRQLKKGIVYYETPEDFERKMKLLNPNSYVKELDLKRIQKLDLLDAFVKKHGQPTELFMEYITAEIEYDWAFKMMMYGYAFQNWHGIKENFFDFAEEVILRRDAALANEKYRKFLVGYVNMLYDKSGRGGNPYIGQYKMASELVSGVSLAFFQADILARGFKKNELSVMLPTYNEFVKTVPYNEFYLRAVDAYFSKKLYAIGTPATDFALKDANDEIIALYDFKGKVVVLNFWASWCRPCINKIEDAKTVKFWLENSEHKDKVIFMNISLERDEARFHKEIEDRELGDMYNFWAVDGMDDDIMKVFDVKAVPEFFIISRRGTFAKKPNKTDPFSLYNHLESMVE